MRDVRVTGSEHLTLAPGLPVRPVSGVFGDFRPVHGLDDRGTRFG